MFHPVGSLPPAVYWRRRIFFAATLAAMLLAILTVFAVVEPGHSTVSNSAAVHSVTPGGGHTGATTPAAPPSSPAPSVSPTNSPSGSPTVSASGSATGALPKCIDAQLTIMAATQAPTYKVGQQPTLILEVTNNGPGQCTQNLADSQVELRVYNGAARVWGSHDCKIQPGTTLNTLAVGTTVGVQVVWSGLSSQPKCAGVRQRVGAGTYTLYALLGGTQGIAAKFTITA